MADAASHHAGTTQDGSERKRAFKGGPTPKCGACKTCIHKSMKQACLTNRKRMAEGLEPVFLTEEAKTFHASTTRSD